MRSSALLRASLLASASRWNVANGATLMSKTYALPASVHALSLPAEDHVMTLQIGLKLQNIDQLEEKLKAVSTPGSPDYGKYMEADEVNEMFNPSEESRAAVKAWLKDAGVTEVADFGWYINFATSVSNANSMLGSSFQNFMVDGVEKLRTLEYSIPDNLVDHVELLSPTTFFGRTKANMPVNKLARPAWQMGARQASNSSVNCARLTEPPCLEEMYNYGGYNESADSGSRVGFGSFLNQSAIQTDLTLYQKDYGLPLTNFSVVLINGGEDHQDPKLDHGEANLDSQFMAASAKSLPMTQFITAGKPPFIPNPDVPDDAHNTNEPYLEYYQFLMNQSNADIPQVISNSYGDDEQTVPKEYAVRVCNLIGMMGLRGITVMESSGDTGVGAPCQSNDGKETPEFTPQFPGTCPYITAVGGTQAYAPEVAWSASSGGFSNYFDQAWYQKEAVANYLDKNVDEDVKTYFSQYANFEGRGFPDISAHSLSPPYLFYSGGAVAYTGGTSAAVPLVAGLIGLLNDARLRAGKPTMGFINPWLYAAADATSDGVAPFLIDVTAGKVQGCTGTNLQTGRPVDGAVIPGASWNGTVGWDPATGLGMPDLKKMLDAVLKMVE